MLSSPQSLKIVKCLLRRGHISQYKTAGETGVSIGQVNKVVKRLKQAYLVSKDAKSRRTVLSDIPRLLSALAIETPMESKIFKRYAVGGTKESIEGKIGKLAKKQGYAFTLLSALPYYSAAAAGERISLYVSNQELEKIDEIFIENNFRPDLIGNVEVYNAHEGVLWDRKEKDEKFIVSKEQLLIDLYGTPQLSYVATQLQREMMEALRK